MHHLLYKVNFQGFILQLKTKSSRRMVQAYAIAGVISCITLAAAAICTIITLGIFTDVTDDSKDSIGQVVDDHCLLFAEFGEGFGANGICNYVIAGEVIALVLLIIAGVTLVVSFIVSK